MHPAWLAVADDSKIGGWIRGFQSERPVWTMGVVVGGVDPQDQLQVARGVPETGQWSCCAFVFVDQAAEDIAAVDLLGGWRSRALPWRADCSGADRSRLRWGRWRLSCWT